MGRQCVLYITRISIHAPAKGATSHVVKISLSITYFNPRSREGSDLYNAGLTWRSAKFQSTLPRRERRRTGLKSIPGRQFQSTLPRRERQHLLTFNNADALISIHAPAKGATTYCVTAVKIHSISIHAPAKGATQDKNPLHPQEEKISIHAPAKGATAPDLL